MALNRVWIPSPNYSSRNGSGVRLVVLHTAEGARSFRDLGGFFGSSSSQVSSHVGIDDERGTIGEYVKRPDKAWCQASYNPQSICVEMCAAPINSSYPCGANWNADEWNRHDGLLANVADWIAEECDYYDLPIKRLSAAEAQGSGRGVTSHNDLGAGGGGHWDPGPNFPWDRVLDMARGGTDPEADDPAGTEGRTVVLNTDGRVEAFAQSGSAVAHRWQAKPGGAWNESGWSSLGKP